VALVSLLGRFLTPTAQVTCDVGQHLINEAWFARGCGPGDCYAKVIADPAQDASNRGQLVVAPPRRTGGGHMRRIDRVKTLGGRPTRNAQSSVG
jgi:hypothetical protein